MQPCVTLKNTRHDPISNATRVTVWGCQRAYMGLPHFIPETMLILIYCFVFLLSTKMYKWGFYRAICLELKPVEIYKQYLSCNIHLSLLYTVQWTLRASTASTCFCIFCFFQILGIREGGDVKSLYIFFWVFPWFFFMVLELLCVGASYSRLYGVQILDSL